MADVPTCPICGKPTVTAFRPFCSRRCASIDLGRWFSEDYRVPSEPSDESTENSVEEDDLPA
ncbi:DNA gyrase inhibitor YacG [Acetobacter conturbans]|uniref:DNA gyrase inhibitor YacG n=1 Tax=Acetobacter conturbans TaxID=1737472 RepID=A0ABX0JVQ7_9PROT|nr:DNA gyrase inhibitor YacG [Acetobacter conturbans]